MSTSDDLIDIEKLNQVIEQERYLEFNLGDERYCVTLLAVKEVIAVPETTSIPFTPEYFLGIMNLRGQVISILDMRKRMTIEPLPSSETAVIIVNIDQSSIGLVVDSINRVFSIEKDKIGSVVNSDINPHLIFVSGIYQEDDQTILMLNPERIIEPSDRELIVESQFKEVG